MYMVSHFPVQFSSLTQSCPTLCDPMDCSTPGLPVLHYLPKPAQTHVHSVYDVIQPSHSLPPSSFTFSLSVASVSFPVSQLLTSGGQSIGASASVLLVHIQGWFLLEWTGLISQSKGLSGVFSSTTIQKHQFLGVQLSLWSRSHICIWLLEKR